MTTSARHPHHVTRLLQWNINGAAGRKALLEASLANGPIDICILQESLLREPSTFRVPGYQVFSLAQGGMGRGLVTLVRDSIPAERWLDVPDCGEGVEVLGVKVALQDTALHVVNIYRPARSTLELGEIFAEASVVHMVLGGDFNAHHPVLHSSSRTNAAGQEVAMAMDAYDGLQLLNSPAPTHVEGGVLDLTFISTPLLQCTSWEMEEEVVSDHFGLRTTLSIPLLPPPPGPPARWDFSKADWPMFRELLDDWATKYVPTTLDCFARDLAEATVEAANSAIPTSRTGPHTHRHAWFYSPEVAKIKHQLNQARKAFRRHRNEHTLATLREVARGTKEQLQALRTEKWLAWCQQMSTSTSSAEIWRWLRRVAGRRRDRPPPVACPDTEANRLAELFVSRAAPQTLPREVQDALADRRQEREELVRRASGATSEMDTPFVLSDVHGTRKTGTNTAPGRDGVVYSLLSKMGPAAEQRLLELCNMSLQSGRLPAPWKQQVTIPIPKRGDMANPRPISLISCIGKTMERMMMPRIIYRIGPFSPYVYAFRRGVGTQDCLSDLLAHIGRGPAITVFLDLDKAYEREDPLVVLSLLARRGVEGNTLRWLQDFLHDRTSTVRLQGTFSEERTMPGGTPQGSTLSPLLFNIIMDELLQIRLPESVRVMCYADDLAIVAVGQDRLQQVNETLEVLGARSRQLGLLISPQKSRAISFRSPRPP